MSTVFGLIIQGKLPSKKVFENERILAIEDLHPVAPVHILIMPKKEIPNLQSAGAEDLSAHRRDRPGGAANRRGKGDCGWVSAIDE